MLRLIAFALLAMSALHRVSGTFWDHQESKKEDFDREKFCAMYCDQRIIKIHFVFNKPCDMCRMLASFVSVFHKKKTSTTMSSTMETSTMGMSSMGSSMSPMGSSMSPMGSSMSPMGSSMSPMGPSMSPRPTPSGRRPSEELEPATTTDSSYDPEQLIDF